MFAHLYQLETLDLGSHFDVSNVVSAGDLFQISSNNTKFKTLYSSSDLAFALNSTTAYIFWGSRGITGGYGTTYNENKLSEEYAVIDCGTKRPGYLTFRGTQEEYEAFCSQFD